MSGINLHSAEWLAIEALIQARRAELLRRLTSSLTSFEDTQFIRGQLHAFEQIESLATPAAPALVGHTTF